MAVETAAEMPAAPEGQQGPAEMVVAAEVAALVVAPEKPKAWLVAGKVMAVEMAEMVQRVAPVELTRSIQGTRDMLRMRRILHSRAASGQRTTHHR